MSRGPVETPRDRRVTRSVATLGMAIAGPIALASGAAVFATLWSGTPRPLVGLFLITLSATVLSTLLYLMADIRERYREPEDD